MMNKKNLGIGCIAIGVIILVLRVLDGMGVLHGLSHVFYPIQMFFNMLMDAFGGILGFVFRNFFVLALILVGILLVKSASQPRTYSSNQRLCRNLDDRKIAGVCSGIAEALGIDPTIVRIIAIFLLLSSFGFVFWIYIILAILLPGEHLGY